MNPAIAIVLAAAWIVGCGGEPKRAEGVDLAPVAISGHACAVCGMLVRDQSAPRAQVVHRDGERAFTCSLGDLLAYLQAPSPHGAPAAVLVEVMSPGEDPGVSHVEAHPWVRAEAATFVVGVPRPRIMGEPVLSYRDADSARGAATGPAARLLDFAGLRAWWADAVAGKSTPGERR
jgi:nitrous oxide reductase accessory protein NosL